MNLHIKDFPKKLHRELKIRAAVESTSIKGIVIKATEQYLKEGGNNHGENGKG